MIRDIGIIILEGAEKNINTRYMFLLTFQKHRDKISTS